jgi:hypothetical protein
MADDKSQQGRDRAFVAGGQDYDIRHFAQEHGISTEQARELIERFGNDRDQLEAAAAKLK